MNSQRIALIKGEVFVLSIAIPVLAEEATYESRFIFEPTADTPAHMHSSCIVQCPNGDLLAVWYENGDPLPWVFRGHSLLNSGTAKTPRGLPIGNLTSQFWANCYLNPFDDFVGRELRCAGYVRYVDDFVLFANTKGTLWEWRIALVERIRKRWREYSQGPRPSWSLDNCSDTTKA